MDSTAIRPRMSKPKQPALLRIVPLALWLLIGFGLCTATGCVGPFERKALLGKDDAEKIKGPLQRQFDAFSWRKKPESPDNSAILKPLAGTDDYLAAEKLYEDGDYAAAEKAFKKVAKKYKKSEIREDALFMEAECAFQQKHYSRAHDRLAVLLKEFPSTHHIDDVSRRLFKIAQIWLDFPAVASLDEVKQVNFEDPRKKLPPNEPPPKPKHWAIAMNLSDKSRPLFDPEGNGVACLKAIWTNDGTGPLADDALMLQASYYARKGDYVQANRDFATLRELFPHSPYIRDAFVLGGHTQLMSYQGSDYDGKALDDAEQLKKTTLRLYPDAPQAERIRKELEQMAEAKAARDWSRVEFYAKQGNKRAVAIYCHMVLKQHAGTSYYNRARDVLTKLGPEYVDGSAFNTSQPDPKVPWWVPLLPASTVQTVASGSTSGSWRNSRIDTGRKAEASKETRSAEPRKLSDDEDSATPAPAPRRNVFGFPKRRPEPAEADEPDERTPSRKRSGSAPADEDGPDNPDFTSRSRRVRES